MKALIPWIVIGLILWVIFSQWVWIVLAVLLGIISSIVRSKKIPGKHTIIGIIVIIALAMSFWLKTIGVLVGVVFIGILVYIIARVLKEK